MVDISDDVDGMTTGEIVRVILKIVEEARDMIGRTKPDEGKRQSP